MDAELIMALVIMSVCALIMVGIGISQMRKKDVPVGFYNLVSPPEKEEISDIRAWNRKHGIIWIFYGVCIELGFWLGVILPAEWMEIVFSMGGVLLPLPFMVFRHRSLVKKYWRK